MAGDNPKGSSNKRPPPSSSSDRKSRWTSTPPAAGNPSSDTGKASKPSADDVSVTNKPNHKPSDKPTPKRGPGPSPAHPSSSAPRPGPPGPNPGPNLPFLGPPPPPTYGFHMLDRRTVVLADGSVRSYFALPPDYHDFTPPPRPPMDPMGQFGPEFGRLPPLGPMSPDGFRGRGDPFGPEGSMKRKFGEGEERGRDERDEFARQRQQLLKYGNAGGNNLNNTGTSNSNSNPFVRDDEFRSSKIMRFGFDNNLGTRQEVDPAVLKSFLNFVKLIIENPNQRKNYLENGKHGPVQCLACGRSSKDFPDVHGLIMHTYISDNADLRVDHLGLHRALCVLMGWNYLRAPDNSRAYQFLSAEEAAANQDDLIIWPPTVIIHNTNTGKGKDGRMEGLGIKAMDSKLRDLGFPGGKSKSLYGREGHLGLTLIKFSSDQSGLKEAMRLADHFEKERHGRRDWAHVQPMSSGRDDENNPNLVTVDERTREKRRILYGYLGTVFDLDKLDFETKKKVAIESKREKLQPSK